MIKKKPQQSLNSIELLIDKSSSKSRWQEHHVSHSQPLRLNLSPHSISSYIIEDHGGCMEAHGMTSRKVGRRRKERQLEARRREERKGKVVGEEREAAGSAALIKLAEDNEPVCWLACLAV